MNKSFKKILCVLMISVLVVMLVYTIYNYINRYEPDNFVGLTAEQIIDKHGNFDGCTFWDSNDTYRMGMYIIKQKRVGFLGTYNEEYFVINFDKNGIAYECTHEIGGKGG